MKDNKEDKFISTSIKDSEYKLYSQFPHATNSKKSAKNDFVQYNNNNNTKCYDWIHAPRTGYTYTDSPMYRRFISKEESPVVIPHMARKPLTYYYSDTNVSSCHTHTSKRTWKRPLKNTKYYLSYFSSRLFVVFRKIFYEFPVSIMFLDTNLLSKTNSFVLLISSWFMNSLTPFFMLRTRKESFRESFTSVKDFHSTSSHEKKQDYELFHTSFVTRVLESVIHIGKLTFSGLHRNLLAGFFEIKSSRLFFTTWISDWKEFISETNNNSQNSLFSNESIVNSLYNEKNENKMIKNEEKDEEDEEEEARNKGGQGILFIEFFRKIFFLVSSLLTHFASCLLKASSSKILLFLLLCFLPLLACFIFMEESSSNHSFVTNNGDSLMSDSLLSIIYNIKMTLVKGFLSLPVFLSQMFLNVKDNTSESVNLDNLVDRLLNSPAFHQSLRNERDTNEIPFSKMLENSKDKISWIHEDVKRLKKDFEYLQQSFSDLQKRFLLLQNDCSNKSFEEISTESLLESLLSNPTFLEKFATKKEMSNLLLQSNIVTLDTITDVVTEALNRYDADKTGKFDYALESAGGSIVSTRCTETFVKKTALYTLFGIPLWYPSNNPRVAIQPGVHPGECWAFKGSQGYLVIQLSSPIIPSQFSMEHISKSMSPTGNIDSAPKDFSVFGLKTEKDPHPVLLGNFSYSTSSGQQSLQIFPVHSQELNEPFHYIELKISSNHGNVNYTCLYRFRVHGHPTL